MEKSKKGNTLLSLNMLVRRNIQTYLKDKMMVLFSVLAPVIVLLIYVLFLGDLQVKEITNYVGDLDVTTEQISAVINNWMIAGVMGVSCLTVAVNANMTMVRDRSTGTVNDILVSPVKRWVIYASYIISCFLITFCICMIILFISLIYLACTGGFMLAFSDILALIGITILSCISSAFFIVLLCSFIKSVGTMSAFNGIYGTVIGFLTGAYLPFEMMPTAMSYVACFVPGTYSAGLYRNYFMKGIVKQISQIDGGAELIEQISKSYSLQLEFFGVQISSGWMVFALIVSIVVFGSLLLIFYSNKRTNFFTAEAKKIKNRTFGRQKVTKATSSTVANDSEMKQSIKETENAEKKV